MEIRVGFLKSHMSKRLRFPSLSLASMMRTLFADPAMLFELFLGHWPFDFIRIHKLASLRVRIQPRTACLEDWCFKINHNILHYPAYRSRPQQSFAIPIVHGRMSFDTATLDLVLEHSCPGPGAQQWPSDTRSFDRGRGIYVRSTSCRLHSYATCGSTPDQIDPL